MYSKHIKDNNMILILDEPIIVDNDNEITEFNLNTLNDFEEEVYYTINYINLIKDSSVNFYAETKRDKTMNIRIAYAPEVDEIKLIISYELPNSSCIKKEFVLDEKEFITDVINEMLLTNNKYIYNIPIIDNIAKNIKEEIFHNYIDNYALIVDTQIINSTIKCLSREDDSCIATANRFMYIPEDDSIILCEAIESSNLIDLEHECLDLKFISNNHEVTLERASLASRSKGKVKYICLVVRNSTIKIEDTYDEEVIFNEAGLKLPDMNHYLENKSVEELANELYDNNNQNKINLFYKMNNIVAIKLININAYLL